MTLSKCLLSAALAMAAAAANAAPYPHPGPAPAAIDLGDLAALPQSAALSVTVSLKLGNAEQLEPLLEAMYTQGSPQYHQFLTPQQFRERFGPSADTIASVTQHFEAAGLTVTRAATAQLNLRGSAAAVERAFGVQLHSYLVPATASESSYGYHAPLTQPQLPATISGSVQGVFGLDTRPRFFPHVHAAAHAGGKLAQREDEQRGRRRRPQEKREMREIAALGEGADEIGHESRVSRGIGR